MYGGSEGVSGKQMLKNQLQSMKDLDQLLNHIIVMNICKKKV
jgi:hypothetical protein